jgi:hypothetical protein
MLRLVSKITIGAELPKPITFDFVNDVAIDSSYENLTDNAKVTLPMNLTLEGKSIAIGTEAVFKRGMSIKIELGYDDVLKTAFEGYISHVNLSVPIVLECDDRMWLLKKNVLVNKSYSTVSLATLLKYIIPKTVDYTTNGFTFENLGKIRLNHSPTSSMVIDMLRKTYQLYAFFRDSKLYVGLTFHTKLQKRHTFGFEENIIDDKSLEWKDSDEVKIRVKGVSIQSNNDKREYTYPAKDAEGQTMTLTIPNLNQADLEKAVKRRYDSFQYSGYTGHFTTFGEPFVNHGDIISFSGNKIPERNEGSYLVRSVKRSFGMDGYRQVIEIAQQIQE